MSSSGSSPSSSDLPTLEQVKSSANFKTLLKSASITNNDIEILADSANGKFVVIVPKKIPNNGSFDKETAYQYFGTHISSDGGVTDGNGKCIRSTVDSNGKITSVEGQLATSASVETTKKTPYSIYFIESLISGSTEPDSYGNCPVNRSKNSKDM